MLVLSTAAERRKRRRGRFGQGLVSEIGSIWGQIRSDRLRELERHDRPSRSTIRYLPVDRHRHPMFATYVTVRPPRAFHSDRTCSLPPRSGDDVVTLSGVATAVVELTAAGGSAELHAEQTAIASSSVRTVSRRSETPCLTRVLYHGASMTAVETAGSEPSAAASVLSRSGSDTRRRDEAGCSPCQVIHRAKLGDGHDWDLQP